MVARVPIAEGSEITIDYATVFNERMPAFACLCDSDRCRGHVRGTDHLEPFVEQYGHHISDYVRAQRAVVPPVTARRANVGTSALRS